MIPWSYSKLSDFEQCQYKAWCKHIAKLPTPPQRQDFFEKGNEVHEVLEMLFGDKVTKIDGVDAALRRHKSELTPRPRKYIAKLQKLIDKKGVAHTTEEKWGFNSEWLPLPDWNASDVWCRMKSDLTIYEPDKELLTVVDWKTGKMYDTHEEQGSLYALGGYHRALLAGHKIKKVVVQFPYLEYNVVVPSEYRAGDMADLGDVWAQRVAVMKKPNDKYTSFPPCENEKCRWCEYAQYCTLQGGTPPKMKG